MSGYLSPTSDPPREQAAPAPTIEQLARQIRELEARVEQLTRMQPVSQPLTRVLGPDEFGFDPAFEERCRPLLDLLFSSFFRVEARGLDRVPARGPCLLVANSTSGTTLYEGLMLRVALLRAHRRSDLRFLDSDATKTVPILSAALSRLGGVRASVDHTEILLNRGTLVACVPQGRRHTEGGLGCHQAVRVCLRTRSPLLPCAILPGYIGRVKRGVESVLRGLRLSASSVTLLPAPTRWTIVIGEPLSLGGYGEQAEEDDGLVADLARKVEEQMRALLAHRAV